MVRSVVVVGVVGDGRCRGWRKFDLESHLLSDRRERGRGCLGISISLGSAGRQGQGTRGDHCGQNKTLGQKRALLSVRASGEGDRRLSSGGWTMGRISWPARLSKDPGKACVEAMTAEKKSWGAKSAELWGVIPGSADFKHSCPEVVCTGPGHAGNPKHMLPRDAPLRFAASVRAVPSKRQEGGRRRYRHVAERDGLA